MLFIHQFFTFEPSAQTKGSQLPRVLKAQFGDGYTQRVRDGAQNALQMWNLVFTNRSQARLKQIDDFLDQFHGVNAFVWKPPAPFGPRWFTCKNWDFEYGDGEIMTGINATFEEQIGPAMAELLLIISGDFQTGAVGTTLPNALVVKVIDSGGNPVVGFPLTWSVVAGGGHISALATSTNSLGEAQVTLTLGPVAITNQVQCTGVGLGGSPATFFEFTAVTTDNWAGNDFDWMPLGVTTDVGTETNVGDTALGIPTFSNFPRFLIFDNWVGQDFDALTVGAITAPPATAGVGDTSLIVGRIVV